MTGKKAPKVNGTVQRTFAKRVREMLESKYKDNQNRPMALANDAGISLSSVQRALSGETAPTLDTVEAIANAFKTAPHTLIQPVNNGPIGMAHPTRRAAIN